MSTYTGKAIKRAAERESYTIDVSEDADDSDVLSAVVFSSSQASDGSTVTIPENVMSSLSVQFQVSGGNVGQDYVVTCMETWASGRITQDDIKIMVR